MGRKWWKVVAYPLRTDHPVPIVYAHEGGWRPKEENPFVQEKVRVVTSVLILH